MRRLVRIIALASLPCFLGACGVPEPAPPTATEFVLTPTASATSTPPVPTETPTVTPAGGIRIYALDMIDRLNGWAWAFAPSAGVLLRTGDGGRTWIDVRLQDLTPNPTLWFFLDAQTAWVEWYDPPSRSRGLLRTADGGLSWDSFESEQSAGNGFRFTSVADGWYEQVDIGGGQAHYWIIETHDGGASWAQVMLIDPPDDPFPAMFAGTIHLCSICGASLYYDPLRLVIVRNNYDAEAGTPLGLSVSTDLGASWQNTSLLLPTQAADGFARGDLPVFFDELNGLLPVKISNRSPVSPYDVLVLYATADGGLTWTQLPAVLPDVDASAPILFVSPLDAFAACGANLCVTHDGAQTWQKLEGGLSFATPAAGEHVLQFDFVDATTGWALSGLDGGATALWQTADGGVSWTQMAPLVLP